MRSIVLAPDGSAAIGLSSLDMTFPLNGRAVGYATAAASSIVGLSDLKDTVRLYVDDAYQLVSVADVEAGAGECKVTLVAGRNAVNNTQPARALDQGLSFGDVARYMVEQAGEHIDIDASTAELMGLRVPYWQIEETAKTSAQLNRLCALHDARWTFTKDGKVVFLGAALPDAVLPSNVNQLASVDWTQSISYLVQRFDAMPQAGLLGDVMYEEVQLMLSPKSSLIRLSPQSSTRRFLGAALASAREESFYNRRFLATVVSQNDDGTLKVQPDDDSIAGSGIDHVMIRYGVPGAHATSVAQGTRVVLEYCNADPSVIHASSFLQEDGHDFLLTIGRPADASFVARADKTDERIKRLEDFVFTQMILSTPSGPSSPGVTNSPGNGESVAASKLKAV